MRLHRITLMNIASVMTLMTSSTITAATNTAKLSSIKRIIKSSTTNRSIWFRTQSCNSSYNTIRMNQLPNQPFRTMHMNQRMAFIKLVPYYSNSHPHIRTLVVDPLSATIPGIQSRGRLQSPPIFFSKQNDSATGTRLYHSSPQRNFLGNNKNNQNDEDKSIIGQVKNIAKKFLPSTWFQSDEERRQIAEQKQIQKEIQTGIQQMFKDAPLPIRMVSNMISPIFGSMMSSLAETAASQQSLIDIVYDQAVQSIRTDPSVQGLLGDSITVGRPFSQSSSSSSINGVTSTRIELAFPVAGRLGNGVGRLAASGGSSNPIIETLVVQANGRVIDVNVGTSSFSQQMKVNGTTNPYKRDNSNVIDAEIIEKDTKI